MSRHAVISIRKHVSRFFSFILFVLQEKNTEAKKARKEENGGGGEDEPHSEEEDLEGEDEGEEDDDEEVEGEEGEEDEEVLGEGEDDDLEGNGQQNSKVCLFVLLSVMVPNPVYAIHALLIHYLIMTANLRSRLQSYTYRFVLIFLLSLIEVFNLIYQFERSALAKYGFP